MSTSSRNLYQTSRPESIHASNLTDSWFLTGGNPLHTLPQQPPTMNYCPPNHHHRRKRYGAWNHWSPKYYLPLPPKLPNAKPPPTKLIAAAVKTAEYKLLPSAYQSDCHKAWGPTHWSNDHSNSTIYEKSRSVVIKEQITFHLPLSEIICPLFQVDWYPPKMITLNMWLIVVL